MMFIPALLFLLAVEVIFDPGVYVIKLNTAPAIKYDTNTKSWAVPSYNSVKDGIICLEKKGIDCLKGS